MTREFQIYAKEQQIKVIESILCSLCSSELNADGRKHLKKIKEKIKTELIELRFQKIINEKAEVAKLNGLKPIYSEVIKNSW